MHINFSFQRDDGGNALDNGPFGGPDHMNDLARGCIAGLMHHHRGPAGLLAPTANSYQRMQPGILSGYWQNWGGDHRCVTTRISCEGGAKSRLEHRMADATANPYTATAAVLQPALLGVQKGYDLVPAETGDGFDMIDAKGLFVEGAWQRGKGETLDVLSPIDGQRLTSIARATPADVDRAVASARRAFLRPAGRAWRQRGARRCCTSLPP